MEKLLAMVNTPLLCYIPQSHFCQNKYFTAYYCRVCFPNDPHITRHFAAVWLFFKNPCSLKHMKVTYTFGIHLDTACSSLLFCNFSGRSTQNSASHSYILKYIWPFPFDISKLRPKASSGRALLMLIDAIHRSGPGGNPAGSEANVISDEEARRTCASYCCLDGFSRFEILKCKMRAKWCCLKSITCFP